LESINNSTSDNKLLQNIECFEPKIVYLERTGSAKIVTIAALICHFLPYFNSSVNPIIYNVMSGNVYNYILNFLSFFNLS
jgi:hypothetical protein